MAPIEQNLSGYWGKTTATIDWCEANYEITHYVAEYWNTVSNIFMIVPPFFGALFSFIDGLELRYVGCHLSLMMVGIGSAFFHGTLLYGMQLLDELPMIWGTTFMIYALAEIDSKAGSQNRLLQLGLFLYCLVVTLVYISIKEPIFHETAYGFMVFGVIYYSLKVTRNQKHSLWLFSLGLVLYAIGFFLWNLDNLFCKQFQMARQRVGYPWSPVLQGHAWWHVLVGVGTYLSLLFSMHARETFLKRNPKITFFCGFWPLVRVSNKAHSS